MEIPNSKLLSFHHIARLVTIAPELSHHLLEFHLFLVGSPSLKDRIIMAAVVPANNNNTTPMLTVDTQHEDLVHDAQLDYYGCKLATSSSGECVV